MGPGPGVVSGSQSVVNPDTTSGVRLVMVIPGAAEQYFVKTPPKVRKSHGRAHDGLWKKYFNHSPDSRLQLKRANRYHNPCKPTPLLRLSFVPTLYRGG